MYVSYKLPGGAVSRPKDPTLDSTELRLTGFIQYPAWLQVYPLLLSSLCPPYSQLPLNWEYALNCFLNRNGLKHVAAVCPYVSPCLGSPCVGGRILRCLAGVCYRAGAPVWFPSPWVWADPVIRRQHQCCSLVTDPLILNQSRGRPMTNLDCILQSRDVTLPTNVRLVKAMVFPVVVYGCESWTIKKAEHRRIDAFELWC